MSPLPFTLVCFAMKDEARPFIRGLNKSLPVRTLICGVGHANAERSIRAALANDLPDLVLTCGFAGGLLPGLPSGTLVFSANGSPQLQSRLLAAGARPSTFHCAPEIAARAEQKRLLRQNTGADAVEMESGVITSVCREHKIPCATVRVILDTAEQDLPLDFNALMTRRQELHYGKLAVALARSPQKLSALLQLQKDSRAAAERLAAILLKIIPPPAPGVS